MHSIKYPIGGNFFATVSTVKGKSREKERANTLNEPKVIFEKSLENLELEKHRGYVGGCGAHFRKCIVTV